MPISLLNGLSSLGAGVAQFAGTAGLEQQKSDLAKQNLVLADQLAAQREIALEHGRQDFQTNLEAQRQQFQTGLQGQSQQFQAGQTAREIAARASEGALTRSAELERQRMIINAPPETVKLLRALGVLPDPNAPSPPAGATGSAAATPAPSTGATDATATPDSSASSTTADTSGTSSSAAASPSASTPNLTDNPLVRKTLGLPQIGSQDANRMAIAADVNNDPAFKYKTAGQKAAEVELRVAVAEGKMTDPSSRESMAQGIASYQIAPLSGFSLTKPGGPETMARAIQINPDYQESRYPEVNKGMTAFGSGKQGDIIRSLNVGVQHLDVIDQAGAALGNTDIRALNSLKNVFASQFGSAPPTTFEGLKQIVGTEIEKAVAGGIGSATDRDRLMAALDRANSPAQLQAITDGFRSLMVGQLSGLKTQYEDATGFKSGPFAFESKLVPATRNALHSTPSTAPAAGSPADTTRDALAMAQDAIARGAPRDAVIKRLRDNGIDPNRLMVTGLPQDLGRTPGQD